MFLTMTVAPGMTAPSVSTTTPEIEAVEEPCANAPVLVINARRAAETTVTHRCVMQNPQNEDPKEANRQNVRIHRSDVNRDLSLISAKVPAVLPG